MYKRQDPNNTFYLYVKGYLYHNMKDYDKAIEFYKKTIEVDPNYAEAYSNVGLIYCLQAQDFSEKATTDVNNRKYKDVYKRQPLRIINGLLLYTSEAMQRKGTNLSLIHI